MNEAFNKQKENEEAKSNEENKANVGDLIAFQRNGKELKGIVTAAKLENSVVVDMTVMDNFDEMGMDFEKTVVGHGKYKIIARGTNN
nr:YkvS family protein [Pontibacillus litoralis]